MLYYFFCSISLSFAEDISLIEIETEFVVEIEDIKKFSLTDDFYLIGHEIFNKRVSCNIDTGDLRTYDPYTEFAKVYEGSGDWLIVSRVVKEEEHKYRTDFYWYKPSTGTYKRFGDLGTEKIYSFYAGTSILEPPNITKIFHLYNNNFLLVVNLDANIYQNLIYDVGTGKMERLPGTNNYPIDAVSPDRLTGLLHRTSDFNVYSFVDKKIIKEDKSNDVNGVMYLANDIILTKKSEIFNINMEKMVDVTYTYPDHPPYNIKSANIIWDSNFLITRPERMDGLDRKYILLQFSNINPPPPPPQAISSVSFHQTTATLNDDRVRMREWPLLDAQHVAFLEQDEEVKVLDRSGIKVQIDDMNDYWYKLKRADGTEGWTYGYFLDLAEEE